MYQDKFNEATQFATEFTEKLAKTHNRKRCRRSTITGQFTMEPARAHEVRHIDCHLFDPGPAPAKTEYRQGRRIVSLDLDDDPIAAHVVRDLFFSLRVVINNGEYFARVYESKTFLKAYICYLRYFERYKDFDVPVAIHLELRDRENMFFNTTIAEYVSEPRNH